jgi:heme exporter protein D
MQFETLSDFIQMGGHGQFVWSVYVIGIAVLLYNVIRPKLQLRQLIQSNHRNQQRESQIDKTNAAPGKEES